MRTPPITGDPVTLSVIQRLQEAQERKARQESCSHDYRSVPWTSAFLQCIKCGHRVDDL